MEQSKKQPLWKKFDTGIDFSLWEQSGKNGKFATVQIIVPYEKNGEKLKGHSYTSKQLEAMQRIIPEILAEMKKVQP